MSLLSSVTALVKRSAANLTWSLEDPRIPLSGRNLTMASSLTYGSNSGKAVSPRQAMQYPAFHQGVRLISQDIAKLRLKTFEVQERGRRLAKEHPVYTLLYRNVGETTANLFIEAMVYNCIIYGNSFAWIQRRGDGRPLALWHINPWRVTLWRNMQSRAILYKVVPVATNMAGYQRGGAWLDNKVPPVIRAHNMLHVRGLTYNGLIGMPLIQMAANMLGRALSSEQYTDDFFKNAMVPQGIYSHPKSMKGDSIERFTERMREVHAGSGNRHKLLVLEEDMKWIKTAVTPEDVILDKMLSFNVKDTARLLNIPAPLLQDPDCAGGYNSEIELTRRYYNMTLTPYMSRIERECDDKLFTMDEKEDQQYETEFDTQPLLRGDSASRMSEHRTLVEVGARSPNEVREIEGYNPYDEGDIFLKPLNMSAIDEEDEDTPPEEPVDVPPEPGEEENEANRHAEMSLLQEAVTSCCERFIRPIERAKGKTDKIEQLLRTADEKHAAVIFQKILPIAQVIARGEPKAAGDTQNLVNDLLHTSNAIYRDFLDQYEGEELRIRMQEAGELVRNRALKIAAETYFPRFTGERNGRHD